MTDTVRMSVADSDAGSDGGVRARDGSALDRSADPRRAPGRVPLPLVLPAGPRAALSAWAEAGYPAETCGLLVGRHTARGTEVSYAAAARNVAPERRGDRYVLAPEDFLRADDEARARGMDVVGIWHSHPDHPARPSRTDLESAWEGYAYLIASVARHGVRELRSWCLAGGAFVEQPLLEPPDDPDQLENAP